jgi:hypothetical protein
MLRRALPSSLVAVTAFAAAFTAACARPLAAQRPTTAAATRRILSALADDSMEGRGTGTRGAQRAATFIAGEMKRAGLEPMGDDGYFQRVPITVDSVRIPARKRVPDPKDATKMIVVVDSTAPASWRVSPKLRDSFAALDSIPAARKPTAVNVVGVLRGSDPSLRDEFVLIDAHYDHLGMRGPGVKGDSIFNGADDDASGVTAVLEIARQMATGPKPKRSIIFAATIGEETGMQGTNWFIKTPPVPLTQIVANMEIEMIGRPDSLAGGPGRAWLTGYARSNMGEQLAASGIPIVADQRLDQNFFERSDNIAFARRGIVAHTLSSFNLHSDYHQVTDDISRVDFAHMSAVINAAAKATRILSDGPKPAWKQGGKP